MRARFFKIAGFALALSSIIQPAIQLTVPLNGWIMPAVRLSNHAFFWGEGFKAVMITDSAFYRNARYHQVTDTMGRLDYRFTAELVKRLVTFFGSAPLSRSLRARLGALAHDRLQHPFYLRK
jgi:hypothetical protein